MARKSGEGWLRVKKYADGPTVLFCFQTRRSSDEKMVENHKRVGLLHDFPSEKAQWMEVARLGFQQLLDRQIGSSPTFRELAEHFRKHELKKLSGIGAKAVETIIVAEHNLDRWVLPQWGEKRACGIKSLEIEQWFDNLASQPCGKKNKPLEWGTIQKLKSVMSQVYKHAQRHELIPAAVDSSGKVTNPILLARSKSESSYEAKVVGPEQMMVILDQLDKTETRLEWTLSLVHAATAMRPEECFGLMWADIDWDKGQINIRRGWSKGRQTKGKNEESMTQVVMHPALAQALICWRRETLYPRDTDWVFASTREKGRVPRSASIAAQDYLRPAAVKAGVIPKGYKGRFGWHNLRHSLATFFGANGVNPSVIQSMLRHAKPSTTALYTHGVNAAQLAAQALYLDAIGVKSNVWSDEQAISG